MAKVIHNDPDFLDDRRLSWKARGLLAFILKNRRGVEINIQEIITQSDQDGRISVQSAFAELLELMYAKLETMRDRHGRVCGKTYVVSRLPFKNTDEQETRLSVTDEQENRRTENMLVGEQENGVLTSDDRRAGNPSVGKHACRLPLPFPSDSLSQDLNQNHTPSPLPMGEDVAKEKNNKQERPRKGQKQPNTFYTPAFDRVWNSWPAGRKIGKVETFTIWRERGLEPRANEIFTKIERLKLTAWLDKELKFIPMPETWFSKARYEDDLVPLGADRDYDPHMPHM